MPSRNAAKPTRAVALFLWLSALGVSQTVITLPKFEAAAIKPDKGDRPMTGDLKMGGQLRLTGIPLRLLIAAAWQVKDRDIIGGPSWVQSDRFDVAAKAPPNTSKEDFQLMIRDLLIENLHLAVHNEERTMRLYALTVDKGGPRVRESAADASEAKGCSGGRQNGLAQRRCVNTSMALFADSLPGMSPNYIDLPVVDQTGLAGHYDFNFEWQPMQLQAKDGPAGPTIFDALRTQLGLKLEARKLPVTVVVIDRIERPQVE
jgi:uncharacterized protein (TIGR03435 family)